MTTYKVTVDSDATRWYNSKDQLHCENGPAIKWANGTKTWCINGQLHRENGPAIEYTNGDKEWWINGQLHRENGPAVEWANDYKEWWINGKKVTEAQVMKSCEGRQLTIDGVQYKLVKL